MTENTTPLAASRIRPPLSDAIESCGIVRYGSSHQRLSFGVLNARGTRKSA